MALYSIPRLVVTPSAPHSGSPRIDGGESKRRTHPPNANGTAPSGGGGAVCQDYDDTQLMEGIRSGDVACFERLVGRYWGPTIRYARYLGCDSDPAYDVTQEAFTRLWERRAGWSPSGSVRVWLFRTARNLVIGQHRKRKVRAHFALHARFLDESRAPRTPLQETEALELSAAISDAVKQLSPRRREVFTLFHLQGLSYREVAEIMDIRPQTVANFLHAALADLRRILAPHFPMLAPSGEHGEPDRSDSSE